MENSTIETETMINEFDDVTKNMIKQREGSMNNLLALEDGLI